MIKDYKIRKAKLEDIDFLADVIIASEKSLTENLGLANFFEISNEELRNFIISMLEEEVDGCEFSVSSFFVACYNNEPVAAVGGWLEGYYDDMPSSLLKSNLIGYTFPKENVIKANSKMEVIKGIQFDREKGAYQTEYSYVKDGHQGKFLVNWLLDAHFKNAKSIDQYVKKAQAQPFENNQTIIKILELSGYEEVKRFESKNKDVLKYFPFNVKLLMEKEL